MYESSKDRSGYCSGGQGSAYLWLGANDMRTESEWVYWTSGEPLAWEGPWRGAGPNGGNVENCLVMLAGDFPGLWSDIACLDSYAFCVPCEFDHLSVLYLKGAMLCEGSPINKQYIVSEEKNGRPFLSGFLHSDIFWDPGAGSWVLLSLKEEGVRATWTPSREGMYPFGTRQWTLGGEVCQMQTGTEIPLTLSVCGKGEFTCADGNCIDLSLRCNLRIDCPDESDESLCSVVDIPPGYNTNIPPPSPQKENPLDVKVGIQLIAFPSIVTQDLSMTATFKLSLQWKDVRLNYLNLKEDRSLNKLSSEEVADIWTPRVHFSNALGNVFTNLDPGSTLECLRESPSSPGPPYLPVEVNIFSGRENSLQMSQLYHVTYTCEFDLVMFPFDSQVCSLRFTMVSASAPYLRLTASRALYTGQKDLIEYTIRNVSVEEGTDGDFSAVTVYVRFSRRYEFYLLTLYIPTTLLILIAYSTFYFNPVIFQPRIIVAITALLVLSSLFTQTSNALPKTSYFKMVDVWLFFSILIIFIVVFIQTLVEFSSLETVFAFKRKNKIIQIQNTKSKSEPPPPLPLNLKILLVGRFLIPLIVVIFNIAYWTKAL
ncbi:glycine receptor subunit alpha-2-like [Penaeus monodon]|uniref:glycine receptor subunit alpha-2-like n=1 Tax=Penaeus monodon TaxID=6687 RepID=UPI0018A7BF14|nr:glycine receptor subunit alpha-2-like [Penaeus monodon]